MRSDYVARINRVLDYMEKHLDEELTLEKLSEVAHFSPYHFHRIFRAMMEEPLGRYIQRLRLNRAAVWLCSRPEKSITTIAHDSGFSSSSSFAHAFKSAFGVSARQFREQGRAEERKIEQLLRKHQQTGSNPAKAFQVCATVSSGVTFTQQWSLTMKDGKTELKADVRIEDFEPFRVAYVRHIGPYAGDENLFEGLFNKLAAWAGPRDLLGPEAMFITIYHDDPSITEESKQRISVCVSVPEGTEGSGEVGIMDLPGGRHAVARFRIDADEYGHAWNALCGGWLPDSGYVPDDRPAFERYHGGPQDDPEGKHNVEICLPVRPAE